MASYQKEIKEFIKAVESRGWRADERADGWQLKYRDGVGIVTIHKTPGSPYWRRNAWAAVRRAEREAEARDREVR
jgi:hypothetical protein